MSAVLLAMLAVMPPQSVAPPQSVPEPAAIASIPDATGDPTVTVLPCQCGDTCDCPSCQCADCPHKGENDGKQDAAADAAARPERTEAAYATASTTEALTPDRRPPLTITSAIAGCPPCERFKGDALPRLQAAGWVEGKDYAVRLVPLGSETVPSFAYRGELFTQGYGGWSDWRSKLMTAMGGPERVTHDAQRHEVAKPVQAHHLSPGMHSHQCPCGNRWTHDANAITDFYSAHTCRRCGRLVTVHAD